MKTAMENAGIYRYSPTLHAINRARLRFGVNTNDVADWIHAKMDGAKIVGYNGSKTNNPIYESIDGIRLVIDERTNAVVTILGDITADFLRPALEREKRKLDRMFTRNIRKLELQYAESLRELSEMAINRARARNPQTRALIAERMSDKQAHICELLTRIERMNDDWQAKVRAIDLISE